MQQKATLMKIMYQKVLKKILFKFDPENVHDIFVTIGEFAGNYAPTRACTSFIYNYKEKDISKTIDGITYRTPIILSAGFDTNGVLTRILPALSFGGEEIGSTTAHPCDGNKKPRLTRLIRNKSIIVYKGLRNKGVDALITRLKRTPRMKEYVIGISIARTNNEEANTTNEAGIADYVASFTKLNEHNVGDYYTINISCPNSFSGETFTEPTLFSQLMIELQKIPCTKPLYIKMPINVTWEQFKELLAIADKYNAHGVIIGNLNKTYSDLDYKEDAPKEFRGGLSGKPCFLLSNELIKKTRTLYGKRFTIIGSGGIFTAEDALVKFENGADLIQVVSGMIFEGPGLMKEICESYYTMIQEKREASLLATPR